MLDSCVVEVGNAEPPGFKPTEVVQARGLNPALLSSVSLLSDEANGLMSCSLRLDASQTRFTLEPCGAGVEIPDVFLPRCTSGMVMDGFGFSSEEIRASSEMAGLGRLLAKFSG